MQQLNRWMKSMHSGHVWMASWKPACARQCIQAVDFVSLGPGSLPGSSILLQGHIQTSPKCSGALKKRLNAVVIM